MTHNHRRYFGRAVRPLGEAWATGTLGQKFKIVTNIRRADVGEEVGWVVLELDGEEQEIKRGLEWVSTTGVRVDPLGGDVIDG